MSKFVPYNEKDYLWKNFYASDKSENVKNEIIQRYKTPGDPIAFSSAANIYHQLNQNVPLKRIQDILSSIESHSIHKEFHEGLRNKSYSRFKRYQFQLDLCFIQDLATYNDNIKYFLTVIDCFTRFAFVRPLKNKTGSHVLDAFKNILIEAIKKPYMVVCDKGAEFRNSAFISYCRENNIKLVLPETNTHAAYVERFNRTFQNIVRKFCTEFETKRYIDHVQDIVKSYNLRKHRMIQMSPYEAEKNPYAALTINNIISKQELLIKKTLPNLPIGSYVRISKNKTKFSRGFNEQAQREIFKIKSFSSNKRKPLYYLTNYFGNEDIKGGFYRFELTPVNINTFRIEKILRRRKYRGRNLVLVKWLGYDDQYNQWIDENDLESI
jgi:transposase InsO family protein